jgi:ribosomal protein S27AE
VLDKGRLGVEDKAAWLPADPGRDRRCPKCGASAQITVGGVVVWDAESCPLCGVKLVEAPGKL